MLVRNRFRLNHWEVRPIEGCIVSPEGSVHLEPKVMDVLVCLAAQDGNIAERDAILEEVWGQRAISDEPLTRCIAALRRELGDDPQNPTFIQTVPKRGYRLVCSVEPSSEALTLNSRTTKFAIAIVALFAVMALVYAWTLTRNEVPKLTVDGAVRSEVHAHSVAVLPFVNVSADPEQDYFSDGITEEISSALARISDLHVTSRTSTFALKESNLDIPSMANQLGVRYIVEGSVRRAGSMLRVTAQLIDVDRDRQLWSLTYDRKATDIFAVQDEISNTVAAKLQDTLGVVADAVEYLPQEVGPEAYDLYLKGLFAFNVGTVEANLQAEAFFEKAVELEPTYADAFYRLARARMALPKPRYSNVVRVLAAAGQALDLDPEHGGALTVISLIAPYKNPEKLEVRSRALKMSPSDSFVVLHYGRALEWNFRKDEADHYFRRSLQLDPLNFEMQAIYGNFNMYRGRADKALNIFARIIATSPEYAPAYQSRARARADYHGDFAGALEDIGIAVALNPQSNSPRFNATRIYFALGKFAAVRETIDHLSITGASKKSVARLEALYVYLTGRQEDAAQMAQAGIDGSTGFPDPTLLQIVVSDMIARGALQEAEEYLLESEPDFGRLLTGPAPDSLMDLYSRGVKSNTALLLQHVYTLQGKLDLATDLANRTQYIGLQGRLTYDFEATGHAYYWEALKNLRDGFPERALESLRTSVDMGHLLEWQFRIRDNPLFDEIRAHPDFQRILLGIENDMAIQRQALALQVQES